MDQFLGQLMLVPYTFSPQGWAFCNGQLLSISQNTALFSLLGTNYGGDGRTTFGLPKLQGTVAIGQGQITGGSNYVMGQTGGVENVTLTLPNMATHTHNHMGSSAAASVSSPSAASFGSAPPRQAGHFGAAATSGSKVALSTSALSAAGQGQPHANIQPILVLNWIIALVGVFPSRQ